MKTVRIENGIVWEIIPAEATPVAAWYGEAFAEKCVEAPDEVDQWWRYDSETGAFSEPEAQGPAPEPAPSLEERVGALETETAAISAAIERGLSL